MINFEFRPKTYFDGTGPEILMAKLSYPESTWGEEICLYATAIDGQIHYEAVDFYGNDLLLNPAKSTKPLSLQELILMIERMEVNPGKGLGRIEITLAGIPKVKSLIYVEIEAFFDGKRKHFGF
ncbi:UDP-glucuronosyltransferase [Lunatibacter salilacus]|uniref:UDP-glucuronosyltransferase n=1 Tax=Lunatibacter salilacus TaxID=2483804 RepID=UPI00131C3B06|nr:UDP-glucuronosyltransferase [Lunatibacter salilacus]